VVAARGNIQARESNGLRGSVSATGRRSRGGGSVLSTITVTPEAVAVLFESSVAMAESVCVPSVVEEAVSQVVVYGETVMREFRFAPSNKIEPRKEWREKEQKR